MSLMGRQVSPPSTNYYKDPLLIHTEYIVLLITADTTPVLFIENNIKHPTSKSLTTSCFSNVPS
jgi:hypothetical protein